MSTGWEYGWFTTGAHPDVHTVLGWAMEWANWFGEQGWELVNFHVRDKSDEICVTGMMKRSVITGVSGVSAIR